MIATIAAERQRIDQFFQPENPIYSLITDNPTFDSFLQTKVSVICKITLNIIWPIHSSIRNQISEDLLFQRTVEDYRNKYLTAGIPGVNIQESTRQIPDLDLESASADVRLLHEYYTASESDFLSQQTFSETPPTETLKQRVASALMKITEKERLQLFKYELFNPNITKKMRYHLNSLLQSLKEETKERLPVIVDFIYQFLQDIQNEYCDRIKTVTDKILREERRNPGIEINFEANFSYQITIKNNHEEIMVNI